MFAAPPALPDAATTAAAPPAAHYYVRACEFGISLNLVREVDAATKPLDELQALAIECFFGDETQELSVFSSPTADCFEPAHGLGLVARVIAAGCFDGPQREKYERQMRSWVAKEKGANKPNLGADKKRVSFAIPAASLIASGAAITFSPSSNLNFAPADELHYDIAFSDPGPLGRSLVEGIRSGQIRWTCVHKDDFRGLACSALAACIQRFGDLSDGKAPPSWRPGDKLTADEQVVRLRHMAGERVLKTWPPADGKG